MTHPTDDEIIKRCKAAGIRWLPPAPDAGEGDFPGAFDLVTMVEMRALLATQGEPVAWALGNPRYVHATNIFPAHEFTPDAERADEWTALYDHPAPSALLAEQARTEPAAEFSARVSMLLAHAKRGDRVSHDEVLEIAAMDPDELRRRAVVARDWHRAYQQCLDGLPLKAGMHHTVPAGCWFPRDIRMLVEQLLAAQPLKAEQAKDAAEDAEPPLQKGDYVLATKWNDGDPGDPWGVGFFDEQEGGRIFVLDSAGKQIRPNGFRRAARITPELGDWLINKAAAVLEASPPGSVNLWDMTAKYRAAIAAERKA